MLCIFEDHFVYQSLVVGLDNQWRIELSDIDIYIYGDIFEQIVYIVTVKFGMAFELLILLIVFDLAKQLLYHERFDDIVACSELQRFTDSVVIDIVDHQDDDLILKLGDEWRGVLSWQVGREEIDIAAALHRLFDRTEDLCLKSVFAKFGGDTLCQIEFVFYDNDFHDVCPEMSFVQSK